MTTTSIYESPAYNITVEFGTVPPLYARRNYTVRGLSAVGAVKHASSLYAYRVTKTALVKPGDRVNRTLVDPEDIVTDIIEERRASNEAVGIPA